MPKKTLWRYWIFSLLDGPSMTAMCKIASHLLHGIELSNFYKLVLGLYRHSISWPWRSGDSSEQWSSPLFSSFLSSYLSTRQSVQGLQESARQMGALLLHLTWGMEKTVQSATHNAASAEPRSISGAAQTKQGIDARAQPRFFTIPLNPHFPLPVPSKCAQCFIYPTEEGNKEPSTTEYPFCFLKKSAVIENEGRDSGDSHMSLRKNYKSQQARWWKRTSCPRFCISDLVVLIMKSQNNEE